MSDYLFVNLLSGSVDIPQRFSKMAHPIMVKSPALVLLNVSTAFQLLICPLCMYQATFVKTST